MKNSYFFFSPLIFLLFATSCLQQESETEDSSSQTVVVHPDQTIQDPTPTEVDDVRIFMFGHSLLVHEHTPNPSEEKKVPHWMSLLATAAGFDFTTDGQYGFLQQHANFENINPQWGFENVPSSWTNESTPFSSVDFNAILMTPANFIQYQSPELPYFGSEASPISATLEIFDQSRAAHPGIPFYIYENWPDMAGYGTFPSGVDLARYYNDTAEGSFHQWFLDYHDQLLAARPGSNIKMIPVGPIMAKLLRDTLLDGIPLTSLYEDDAPHGEASLYFLASLVTYMAIYKTQAPENFTIPETVHPLIRANYGFIVNFIWAELQAFQFSDGSLRAL